MAKRMCSVDGCSEAATARGWCHTHYSQYWRAQRRAAGKSVQDPAHVREYRRRRRAADPTWKPYAGARTPEMHRAGEAVRRAIRSGKLVRPETCESCGKDGVAIEAAHYDYAPANYLKVRWLCRLCHRRWDATEPKTRIPVVDERHLTCRNGHPWTEENTAYRVKDGRRFRRCRECWREQKKRSLARAKAREVRV